MAWERRDRGGWYYMRSRKVSGRVGREYVGGGIIGQMAAALDAEDRAEKEAQAEAWRAERDRLEKADAPLEQMFDQVEALARASLMLAGFHRHHRSEWRRKREKRIQELNLEGCQEGAEEDRQARTTCGKRRR